MRGLFQSERANMLSFSDLVTALEHLLPRRQFTAEELADIIIISGTIYVKWRRNQTPDGFKWCVNESDKVELRRFFEAVRSSLN